MGAGAVTALQNLVLACILRAYLLTVIPVQVLSPPYKTSCSHWARCARAICGMPRGISKQRAFSWPPLVLLRQCWEWVRTHERCTCATVQVDALRTMHIARLFIGCNTRTGLRHSWRSLRAQKRDAMARRQLQLGQAGAPAGSTGWGGRGEGATLTPRDDDDR
eukprot:COSAG05_NODE_3348_length_2135_cov_3.137525_2_plen_163_part_00